MLVRIVCWLLSWKRLTTQERAILTNQVLTKLGALPTHAIITVDGEKLSIRGVPLDGERAVQLREHADQALHNTALSVVHEQVLYQAISQGVHVAQTTEQMQFAKAAIWYSQQERELLLALSNGAYANSSLNGDY